MPRGDQSSVLATSNCNRDTNMISSSSVCTTDLQDTVHDRYRSRKDSSYNLKTGWIADCHACGREGKYRPPTEGRPFQHSTGMGKYCGYFRVNPRRASEPSPQGKKRPSSSEELSRIKKLQQDVILQYHQKLSSQEIDHTTLKLSSSLDNALSWAKHRVSSSSMGQGASISDICPHYSTSSTTTMTVNQGHTSSVCTGKKIVRAIKRATIGQALGIFFFFYYIWYLWWSNLNLVNTSVGVGVIFPNIREKLASRPPLFHELTPGVFKNS